MIYLHHRPPTKFSSDSKVPAQTRKHFWTPRMVESWFHSGRSTFLGKVSGKMRYRDGSVGNSEISCFVTMHICHPLSSATPSSKVKCTGCVDISMENFSNNRREPNENPYDDAISFIIFFSTKMKRKKLWRIEFNLIETIFIIQLSTIFIINSIITKLSHLLISLISNNSWKLIR